MHRLKEKGVTVLDLEGLARHRGSVFGRISRTEQPSQKTFETAIYDALVRTPQGSAIVVEAESTAIGARRIPKAFWMRMASAPRLEICAPPEARAGYLVTSYKDLIDDPDALHHALGKLSAYHSRENIASWRALIETKQYREFSIELIKAHYDPLYDRSRARRSDAPVQRILLDAIDDAAIDKAADVVAKVARNVKFHF